MTKERRQEGYHSRQTIIVGLRLPASACRSQFASFLRSLIPQNLCATFQVAMNPALVQQCRFQPQTTSSAVVAGSAVGCLGVPRARLATKMKLRSSGSIALCFVG